MIKNLLITEIPKTKEALTKVLLIVKDHSWSKEAVEAWETSKAKYVWFDATYNQYVSSETAPRQYDLIVKNYERLIEND